MSEKLNLQEDDLNAINKKWSSEILDISKRVIYYKEEIKQIKNGNSTLTEDWKKLLIKHAREFAKALESLKDLNEWAKKLYSMQSKELVDLLNNNINESYSIIQETNSSIVPINEHNKAEPLANKKWNEIVTNINEFQKSNQERIKNVTTEVAKELWIELPWSRIPENAYKNVTWESLNWEITPEQIKKFKEKIVNTMNFIKSLWINSWFYAVLNGKTENFIQDVMKLNSEKRNISSLTPEQISSLTPSMQNTITWLVTAWVLIATSWVVFAWYRWDNFNVDDFVNKVKESKESPVWSFVKDSARYIWLALAWRKLSLTSWEDKLSVDQINDKIIDFAKKVMDLNFDWNDDFWNDNDLKNKVTETIDFAKKAWIDVNNNKDLIKRALLQNYILTLWKANSWEDWKASLSPIFIWAQYDNINVDKNKTQINPDLAKIERESSRQTLTKEELMQIWCKIEKTSDWKFKHTIPKSNSNFKFPWDDKEYPLIVVKPDWDLENSSKIYDFNLSFTSEWWSWKYTLTLEERKTQPNDWDEVKAEWSIKQEKWDVKDLRNWKEALTSKDLPDILYNIWHDSTFWTLLKKLSEWDKDSVILELNALAKKFEKKKLMMNVINLLKKDIKNMHLWETYMYWSKDTRKQKSFKYDNIRTNLVVNAESSLAEKHKFPHPSKEDEFKNAYNTSRKNAKNFSWDQISSKLQGQELTTAVFATPRDFSSDNNKNNSQNILHRISTFDGSIKISWHTKEVIWDDRRKVIEWINNSSKNSIKNQLEKLNNFLKDNSINQKVDLLSYKNYLSTGDIKDLKDIENKEIVWLNVQPWKETKVVEARAMIAWNVCLNLTYAIWYPLFEINGKKQELSAVWSIDAASSMDMESVSWNAWEIWVNFTAFKLSARWWSWESNPPSSSNANTNLNGTVGSWTWSWWTGNLSWWWR